MLLAQSKDATIVCVIGCQITRTRIHTLLECLASARHLIIKENCIPTRMHASNRPVSEDEEEDDVFSRRLFYYGRADVMGCGRPTVGVFIYVSSDTSHADGVPHSDP